MKSEALSGGMDMTKLIECARRLAEALELTVPPEAELSREISDIIRTERLLEAVDQLVIVEREAATILLARLQIWMMDGQGPSVSDLPYVSDPTLEADTEVGLFGKLSDELHYPEKRTHIPKKGA